MRVCRAWWSRTPHCRVVVASLCLFGAQVVVQDLVSRRQEILPGLNTIASLAASRDGRLLACSGDGCDAFGRSPVSLWQLTEDDGWCLLGNRYYHDTVITSLHFSADCRCVPPWPQARAPPTTAVTSTCTTRHVSAGSSDAWECAQLATSGHAAEERWC